MCSLLRITKRAFLFHVCVFRFDLLLLLVKHDFYVIFSILCVHVKLQRFPVWLQFEHFIDKLTVYVRPSSEAIQIISRIPNEIYIIYGFLLEPS